MKCFNTQCHKEVSNCNCSDEMYGDLHDQKHLTCDIVCAVQAMEQRAHRLEHKCCVLAIVPFLVDYGKPLDDVCLCTCHHYWDCKCEEHA